MTLSVNQFRQLSHHLDQSQPNWNEIGAMFKESMIEKAKCKLFSNNESRVQRICKAANKAFVELEKKGIKLFDHSKNEAAEAYKKRFKPYFKICEQLKKHMENLKGKKTKAEYARLQFNLLGLKYSLGELDKLKDFDQGYFEKLKSKALEWKNKEILNLEKDNLDPLMIQQLEEAAKYPEWCDWALKNGKDLEDFFKWSLRDYNPVDVFVLCPNTQKRIKNALLSCVLGRIRKPGETEILAFKEINTKVEGVRKRILTLPFYHGPFDKFDPSKQEFINILDPNREIHFQNGNQTVTLKEMEVELAQKNKREVNFNFCAWGMINFHPVHGVWNADTQQYDKVTFNDKEWIHLIPPQDILKHSHLEKMYGENDDRKIFFKAAATRSNPDLRTLDCHGFIQVFVPYGEDQWKVLDLGVYAYRFQQSGWDSVYLFAATVKRVFSLFDQQGSYTHRQRAALPFFPTTEETDDLLDKIKTIYETEGVFQFGGKNCAFPIQRACEKSIKWVPNFYRMSAWDSVTGFKVVDKIIAFCKKCPLFICRIGITAIHLFFASWRGMTIEGKNKIKKRESLFNYYWRRWEKMELYNPAFLAHQIEKKLVEGGELSWGNTAYKYGVR